MENTINSFKKKSKTKIAHVRISNPLNTYNIIYLFMTHPTSYTFKKNSYVPESLDFIITKEEWYQILQMAEIILWKKCNENKNNTEIKLPKCMIVLAVISVILILAFMLLLCLFTKYQDKIYLYYFSIVCITFGTALGFGLGTYNFLRKPRNFKSLEEQMDEVMKIFFKEINKKYERKINFEYIPQRKWVECTILMKKNLFNFNNIDQIP